MESARVTWLLKQSRFIVYFTVCYLALPIARKSQFNECDVAVTVGWTFGSVTTSYYFYGSPLKSNARGNYWARPLKVECSGKLLGTSPKVEYSGTTRCENTNLSYSVTTSYFYCGLQGLHVATLIDKYTTWVTNGIWITVNCLHISRHTVVCRAAQEAGAPHREYIDRKNENVIFTPLLGSATWNFDLRESTTKPPTNARLGTT